MRIASITAAPWILPLRAPFKIATRTATEARNVLVTVTTDSGLIGLGAAAPVSYVTGETVETVIRDINSAASYLSAGDYQNLRTSLAVAEESLPESPTARAAVEMAIVDVWGKNYRVSNWTYFGAAQRSLSTDLTIPIVSPAEASHVVRGAVAGGFTHFKIKVGDAGGPDADLARIHAVVNAAPEALLRIDANQAFTPDACLEFVAKLQNMTSRVELIEQPVDKSDTPGLRYIKERISIPVFADEAARTLDDVRRLIDADAVDGINIKLMKSGLAGALNIIDLCRARNKKLMIGCMLESRLGLTAALFVAAGTGSIDYIDLDAHRLLAPDSSCRGGFTDEGPGMTVDDSKPGWGIEVSIGGGTNSVAPQSFN